MATGSCLGEICGKYGVLSMENTILCLVGNTIWLKNHHDHHVVLGEYEGGEWDLIRLYRNSCELCTFMYYIIACINDWYLHNTIIGIWVKNPIWRYEHTFTYCNSKQFLMSCTTSQYINLANLGKHTKSLKDWLPIEHTMFTSFSTGQWLWNIPLAVSWQWGQLHHHGGWA